MFDSHGTGYLLLQSYVITSLDAKTNRGFYPATLSRILKSRHRFCLSEILLIPLTCTGICRARMNRGGASGMFGSRKEAGSHTRHPDPK